VDLIFPHHEDEIAQSCAFTGEQQFARYWMHGEFLTLSGTKMSKRFGNILTARDLQVEGVDPGAVRLLIFNTHYRQKLDWSDDALEAAREGSRRLGEFRDRIRKAVAAGTSEDAMFVESAAVFRRDFTAALDDDLNAPRGLAALFGFAREGNRLLDEGRVPGKEALAALALADAVLDVMPGQSSLVGRVGGHGDVGGVVVAADSHASEIPPADPGSADAWALAWATRRREAKLARNYAEADRIREMLRAAGYDVRDGRSGVEIVRLAV
jgi:cysteinyl-tRNA synthetase